MVDSGFSKAQPHAVIPGRYALGLKDLTALPAVDTWNVQGPNLIAIGTDRRFLYPNLPARDASNTTAVADFVQGAETVIGSTTRSLDAATQKAELETSVSATLEPLQQHAVVESDIPEAILTSVDGFRDWINARLRYHVQLSVDTHVVTTILTAAGGPTIVDGTSTLERARNAVAEMRSRGADPGILAVGPDIGATLDLSTSGDGTPYLFSTATSSSASPLFNMRVIESPALVGVALVIDATMLGLLFIGSVALAMDASRGFRSNTVDIRCETNALYHVRDANGVLQIGDFLS